jgi:hypothetical protein
MMQQVQRASDEWWRDENSVLWRWETEEEEFNVKRDVEVEKRTSRK